MAFAPKLLLTGATGYVGGRLLKAIESRAVSVRCLARRPEYLLPKVGPTTEVLAGDILDLSSLRRALRGIDTAYYLVHSMGSAGGFAEQDRQAASNFVVAAREQGLRRIIYLGGLGQGDSLSPHLASRQEVGKILRESGVPTLEFRASVILGSGSLSFEMIRALVERLPVMLIPRWVYSRTQPIAIEDVIAYLVAAAEVPLDESRVVEIGGREQTSYLGLMREYARQRMLRRWMIPVPVLSPRLSSLWLGLVTPLYARVGRKLIDSVRHDTVVTNPEAEKLFPVRPLGVREAFARALRNEDREFAETRWSDAISSTGRARSRGGVSFGSRLVDSRSAVVATPPETVFETVEQIGGENGWYFANALWRIRGFLDLLAGGPGLRRGRRDPVRLAPGDTVDWWRVEAVEPNRLLRLAAEMKLPGRAWLQFEVEADEGATRLRQTALFDPVGLAGRVYWYALFPFHQFVFAGMLRSIARISERKEVRR